MLVFFCCCLWGILLCFIKYLFFVFFGIEIVCGFLERFFWLWILIFLFRILFCCGCIVDVEWVEVCLVIVGSEVGEFFFFLKFFILVLFLLEIILLFCELCVLWGVVFRFFVVMLLDLRGEVWVFNVCFLFCVLVKDKC